MSAFKQTCSFENKNGFLAFYPAWNRRAFTAMGNAPQHIHSLTEEAQMGLSAAARPGLNFTGQITGVEEYVESASSGLAVF